MLNARIPAIRSQALIGFSVFLLGIWVAWEIGEKIAAEDITSVAYVALGLGAAVVAISREAILKQPIIRVVAMRRNDPKVNGN